MKERRPNQIREDEYFFSEPEFVRNRFVITAGSKTGTRQVRVADLTAVDAMRIMLCKRSTQVASAILDKQKIQDFIDLKEVLDLEKTMRNTCLLQIQHYIHLIDPHHLYGAALLTAEYKRKVDKEENIYLQDIVDNIVNYVKNHEDEQ